MKLARVFIVRPTYLITKDIIPTLERKIGIKLDSQTKQEIILLENEFLSEFCKFIPNDVEFIQSYALEVSTQLVEIISGNSNPTLSLDRVYMPISTYSFEITRLTDPITGKITFGSRPGYPSLQDQLCVIDRSKKITVADVGAFEGDTLIDTCTLLENNGVNVENILLGYSGESGIQKLETRWPVQCLNTYVFYDWIEMRDLLGIDGRRIAGKSGFVPYYENLNGWASISSEVSDVASDVCRAFSDRLYNLLSSEGYDTGKIPEKLKLEELK